MQARGGVRPLKVGGVTGMGETGAGQYVPVADAIRRDITTGLPVLITRRVATDTDRHPIAMDETRRSAEDTQLSGRLQKSVGLRQPQSLLNRPALPVQRWCAS